MVTAGYQRGTAPPTPFLRTSRYFAADPLPEPNVVIGLVFSVLLRRIASVQYDQMVRSRRSPIRELWMWR